VTDRPLRVLVRATCRSWVDLLAEQLAAANRHLLVALQAARQERGPTRAALEAQIEAARGVAGMGDQLIGAGMSDRDRAAVDDRRAFPATLLGLRPCS